MYFSRSKSYLKIKTSVPPIGIRFSWTRWTPILKCFYISVLKSCILYLYNFYIGHLLGHSAKLSNIVSKYFFVQTFFILFNSTDITTFVVSCPNCPTFFNFPLGYTHFLNVNVCISIIVYL